MFRVSMAKRFKFKIEEVECFCGEEVYVRLTKFNNAVNYFLIMV